MDLYLQRYCKLNISKPYRIYISMLLLAVYFFIAVPVQVWHHHDVAGGSITVTDKNDPGISKSTGKSVENNCQVCSHQYSTYVDYAAVTFAAPIFSPLLKACSKHLSIPPAPVLNVGNKGPPADLLSGRLL